METVISSKDSIRKIMVDYIDSVFPLRFSDNYQGPKNVSFGKNKIMKDKALRELRSGKTEEEVFRNILREKEDEKGTDEFYLDMMRRYLEVTMPGREERKNKDQMDFLELYNQTADVISRGYGMEVAFRYIVGGESYVQSIVMINVPGKQYVKTEKKSA